MFHTFRAAMKLPVRGAHQTLGQSQLLICNTWQLTISRVVAPALTKRSHDVIVMEEAPTSIVQLYLVSDELHGRG